MNNDITVEFDAITLNELDVQQIPGESYTNCCRIHSL